MACVTTQNRSFGNLTSLKTLTATKIARTRAPLCCKAQLQPCPTSAVATLAEKSKTYAALLACQNTVLDIITQNEQLELIPSEDYPPLNIHGLAKENNKAPDYTVGATVAAWEPSSPEDPVQLARWVSASALANAPLGFGTTRLMAWASPEILCPHFVLELGVMGSDDGGNTRAQGTLSFAQRSDLMLDLWYLDTFYNRKGSEVSKYSFNDVYNRCLGFQKTLNWHHYQVPQADMKPVIANSISYTFPADKESIQAFTDAAADVAQLWTELIIEAKTDEDYQPLDERQEQSLERYDERHEEVVRDDPGNMIAEKLFGKEATKDMIFMTIDNVC
jgi:hypothetical protein